MQEAVERKLDEALACADVLLTSGGVSMGDRDYIKPILEQRGCVLYPAPQRDEHANHNYHGPDGWSTSLSQSTTPSAPQEPKRVPVVIIVGRIAPAPPGVPARAPNEANPRELLMKLTRESS